MKRSARSLFCFILAGIACVTACFASGCGKKNDGPALPTAHVLTNVYQSEPLSFPDGFFPLADVPPAAVEKDRVALVCGGWEVSGSERRYTLRRYEVTETGKKKQETELLLPEGVSLSRGSLTRDALFFLSETQRQDKPSVYDLYRYDFAKKECVLLVADVGTLFPDTSDRARFLLSDMEVDEEGNVYLLSRFALCVLDQTGGKRMDAMPELAFLSLGQSDGTVYAAGYWENGPGLCAIDPNEGVLCDPVLLPSSVTPDEILTGPGYDLYYTGPAGLYGYTAGNAEGELVISYPNSDLVSPEILLILSPETVLASYQEGGSVCALLRHGDDVPIAQDALVEVAILDRFSAASLGPKITAFNRTSQTARLVPVDYSVYATEENAKGAAEKFLHDLVTGLASPDLVVKADGTGSATVLSTVIEQGLFTDLYTFMEGDDLVNRENLIGAVKNTYEADGKLSAIPQTFTVETLLAPSATVEGRTQWTLDELLTFARSLPAEKVLMEGLSGETAAPLFLGPCSYGWFIDWEAGTCHFMDETFLSFLDYLKTLPATRDEAYHRDYSNPNIYHGYQEGVVQLYPVVYGSASDAFFDPTPFMTEDVVRIGYPTDENGFGGARIHTEDARTFFIPSTAAHPEEAWTFLRSLLLEEDPSDGFVNGFCVLKSHLLEISETMADYELYFSNTGSIMAGNTGMELDENGWLDGEPGYYTPFRREVWEAFVDWLDRVGSPLDQAVPAEVEEIIKEELSVFLGGGRGAEETAKILQSRVELWLAEHE